MANLVRMHQPARTRESEASRLKRLYGELGQCRERLQAVKSIGDDASLMCAADIKAEKSDSSSCKLAEAAESTYSKVADQCTAILNKIIKK